MADIGISNIVTVIIGSAGDYLTLYSPLFIAIAGIVLAIGVLGGIIDRIFPQKDKIDDND